MISGVCIAVFTAVGQESFLHRQVPFETIADGGDGISLMEEDAYPASMIQLLLEANENDVTEDAVLQRSSKDVEIEGKSAAAMVSGSAAQKGAQKSAQKSALASHGPSLLSLNTVVRHVKRRRHQKVHEKKLTQPADFNGSFMQTSTLDTQDKALELLTEHVAEAMEEVKQMKLRRAHRHIVQQEAASPHVEVVLHKKLRPSLAQKHARTRRPFFFHDPDGFLQIRSVTRHNVHVVDDDTAPVSFVQLESVQSHADRVDDSPLGEVSLEQPGSESGPPAEESFAQALTNAQDPLGNIVQELVQEQEGEPRVLPGL